MWNKIEQQGFTLLEIMFAVFVFSIGILAVNATTIMVIKANNMSKNLTTAVNLAQNKLDDLKTTNYGSITDSSDNDLDEKGVSGNGIFDRSVSVTTNTNPNYKTIEVEVSWSKYRARKIALKTIITE